jgi:hypothetical protein
MKNNKRTLQNIYSLLDQNYDITYSARSASYLDLYIAIDSEDL